MPVADIAPLNPIVTLLREGVADGAWMKCVFSHPDPGVGGRDWEKLVTEPIMLSRGPAVKMITYERDRQSTLTVTLEQWPQKLEAVLARNPRHINLLARDRDWHARLSKSGRWLVSRGKPSLQPTLPAGELPAHDRGHAYPLPPTDPAVVQLFMETGLFGLSGRLRGEAADKYRQVQHYIELLRPLGIWNEGRPVSIVDAGCGKAYLSLALYLFAQRAGVEARLTGVDRSEKVLASVARSAARLGYENVETRAESIEEYVEGAPGDVDLLLSLHACDTATDEALAAGVRLGARAIVLVPCCHHELVAQIEGQSRDALPAEWRAVSDSGLLRHRLADIVTDALRAAALEILGYAVEIIEFVSPEATARNIMLRAELRPPGPTRDSAAAAAREEYAALAAKWGVHPSLERLLGERWNEAIESSEL